MVTNISLNDIAYDILEMYRDKIKDTDEIDIRQIKFWIQEVRALLLKRKFDKPMSTIDEAYVQDLGAIKIEHIDSSAKSNIYSKKYEARTNIAIPITIERSGHSGTFTRIGAADRLISSFNVVSYERALVSGNGKFNTKDIFAYPKDDRIYFISKNPDSYIGLMYVNIRGVFVNPQAVFDIINPNHTDNDKDYPVNVTLVDEIKNFILTRDFKLTFARPADEILNERNEIITNANDRKAR